jgi:hypothetical protein
MQPERPATGAFPRRAVVIIPTYNEAGNVTTILDGVRAAAPGIDILVVDDDSPDGTAALVTRHPGYAVRLVLGLPVHDTTAGFKAFRRDALEVIGAAESASNGYCFQVENTWRAVRRELRITEVPITFTDRTVGSSKMSGTIVAEALARVLVWRWHPPTLSECGWWSSTTNDGWSS